MEIDKVSQKISNCESLTIDEVYYYLDNLTKEVIRRFNIDDGNLTKCREVCLAICYFYTKNFDQETFSSVPLNLSEIGIENLTHYTSFLKFKTDKGYKCFIIDPTMSQFDTDNYKSNDRKTLNINGNLNEEQLKLLSEFKQKGYVEANANNLTNFVNVFINALSLNNIKIDKKIIHEKFINFLKEYGLVSQNSINIEDEKNKIK